MLKEAHKEKTIAVEVSCIGCHVGVTSSTRIVHLCDKCMIIHKYNEYVQLINREAGGEYFAYVEYGDPVNSDDVEFLKRHLEWEKKWNRNWNMR